MYSGDQLERPGHPSWNAWSPKGSPKILFVDQLWGLGALTKMIGSPKGSLKFSLEHSLDYKLLQTFLWSRMTCSSTFLKYPLAVLDQTPAAYILMYCNAISTTFTAVRCFQLRKKVLRLDATSYQSSDRTVQHLCLWLQNEHEWQFCKEFAPHPGGTNDNDAHVCELNKITVQNKIIIKILPMNKFCDSQIFVTPSFNEWAVFSWLSCFALQ